jgi:hypothetical protein
MARPKAEDPKIQRNVYPPTSLWERIKEIADQTGRPVGEVAVAFMERGVSSADPLGYIHGRLAVGRDA